MVYKQSNEDDAARILLQSHDAEGPKMSPLLPPVWILLFRLSVCLSLVWFNELRLSLLFIWFVCLSMVLIVWCLAPGLSVCLSYLVF